MGKSRIVTARKTAWAKLDAFEKAAEFELAVANRLGAMLCQQEVVARVPLRTGATRAAFADPEAVGLSKRGGRGAWEFGLRTPRLRRAGYRAHWIEFGTKGYKPGERRYYRAAGVQGPPVLSVHGKPLGRPRKGFTLRFRRIERTIPPRPAQPFFRPGIEAARARYRQMLVEHFRRAARRAQEGRR